MIPAPIERHYPKRLLWAGWWQMGLFQRSVIRNKKDAVERLGWSCSPQGLQNEKGTLSKGTCPIILAGFRFPRSDTFLLASNDAFEPVEDICGSISHAIRLEFASLHLSFELLDTTGALKRNTSNQ